MNDKIIDEEKLKECLNNATIFIDGNNVSNKYEFEVLLNIASPKLSYINLMEIIK